MIAFRPGVVVYTCNSSIYEAKVGRIAAISKSDWVTMWIQDQPEFHSETVSIQQNETKHIKWLLLITRGLMISAVKSLMFYDILVDYAAGWNWGPFN